MNLSTSKQFRYVPLLAAGVVVFLGLVSLGGLTGLLWLVLPFGWWIKLNPFVLGPTMDWLLWSVSFLLLISPSILLLARKRTRTDPVVALTFFIFPLLSLAIVSWSHFVGATLLVGSGFLAAYTLVSRSRALLDMEILSAARLVCVEVFAFLTMEAAGGIISILLWGGSVFDALLLGYNVTDPLVGMLAVDLEVFFLARPILPAILITLPVVAIVALWGEPLWRAARSLRRERSGDEFPPQDDVGERRLRRKKVALREFVPYAILMISIALGIAITLCPYTIAGVYFFGVDSSYYIENLRSLNSLADVISLIPSGRSFFAILFLIKTVTGLSAEWVVRLAPALLSVLLALSSFTLVREGTGRLWVAAFAALLSVTSGQTALGMTAGIISNWFALSVANFAFALIVRSIRLHSKLAAVGSLAILSVLLTSYGFLWVVVVAALAVVLAASMTRFCSVGRHEWKSEVSVLSSILSGSVVIPLALAFLVLPLMGLRPEGLDPQSWLTMGWSFVQGADPHLLGSVLGSFERTLLETGNQIDLPFLTVLSILGLLDHARQTRSFGNIMSAMVLVPVLLMVAISCSSTSQYVPAWLTWRGLYVIPMYITGALGVETAIRRVNGRESPWRSCSRLGFAGTFAGYVFLSHLSYSLRALELLIIVWG